MGFGETQSQTDLCNKAFLIQSTQNSDTEAIQIKLDELIRAIEPARNRMLSLEELDESELDELRKEFDELAKKARQA
nr:low affinity iron permease family protein [Comamonas odontotermitis]